MNVSFVSNGLNDIQGVEELHRLSKVIMDHEANYAMEVGMRAARAKDRVFMSVLERAAELINKAAESQYGETVRRPGQQNVLPVEANLWKNAYTHALSGSPDVVYAALYGAVACWVGFCPRPR